MEWIMNQLNSICVLFTVFSSKKFIFGLLAIFILIKIVALYIINIYWQKSASSTFLFLLLIPIVSYLVGELAIFLWFFSGNIIARTFWRIAWNIQPLQFYAQVLFIKSLIQQGHELRSMDKKVLFFLFLFTFCPIFLLFNTPNESNVVLSLFFDIFCKVGVIKRTIIKGSGYFFLILTFYTASKKVSQSKKIPYLLTLQLRNFFVLMCLPILPDSLATFNIIFELNHIFTFNLLRFLDLFSVASFTISLLFFARRIYHLRFLNMTERVIEGPVSSLSDEQIVAIKQQLCEAKNIDQITTIHYQFFKQLGGISSSRIVFHLRNVDQWAGVDSIVQPLEQFIQEKHEIARHFFVENSLLVYDELAFTHFYQYSHERAELLQLLQKINAAVVIPLKYQERLFGAIIITKNEKKRGVNFKIGAVTHAVVWYFCYLCIISPGTYVTLFSP